VAGISVYEDIPGLPVSPALRAFSIVISSLLLLATIFLARARDPRDRALAVFWIVALFILVATAGILTVDQIGVERYMIWLLPPAAITLARFGSILGCSRRIPDVTCAVLTISLASIMLWTFFPDYFAPIRSLAYRRSTYPAYWAADRDLKFAAADWIRAEHLSPGLIHAENWWIDYPLQFDLGLDWTITEDPLPAEIPRGQSVVVCFCNSDQYPGIETDYFTHLRARLASAGRRFNTHTIDAADGKPAVAVIVVQPLPSSGRQ
jgi:hypothetical protein